MYFPGRKPPPDKMNFQFFRHLWMAKLCEVKTEAPEEILRRFFLWGNLKCPGAVSENRNGPAVFAGRVDGKIFCADHEVLVNHRIVDAELAALVERFVLEVIDRV